MSESYAKEFLELVLQDKHMRKLCEQFTIEELVNAAKKQHDLFKYKGRSHLLSAIEACDTPYTD